MRLHEAEPVNAAGGPRQYAHSARARAVRCLVLPSSLTPPPSSQTHNKTNKQEENALLESPTGTGKTLCLLCATLAWRESYAKRVRVGHSRGSEGGGREKRGNEGDVGPPPAAINALVQTP